MFTTTEGAALNKRQSAFFGLVAAFFFATLGLAGAFSSLENKLYDFFLKLGPKVARSDLTVFLNIDNKAIAANGVFPWPRSIMADGLLRLKEYGARAVIFDIEYVDKSPQGIDAVALGRLSHDFARTFNEVGSGAEDVMSSLLTGRVARRDASGFLWTLIENEKEDLLDKALDIARDNDEYFAKAIALHGDAWITLNLRSASLEGEQAGRRSIARERFSYPVKADAVYLKDTSADVLVPISEIAESSRGAGFTNIHVDKDGVRRRVDLLREYDGRWYLQLAFAPLACYLGEPAMELRKNRLILKDAILPSGVAKDIVIPLDAKRRMLLRWPLGNFEESFTNYSFATLSGLELEQRYIERSVSDLASSENLYSFVSMDDALAEIPVILLQAENLLSASASWRREALERKSDQAFDMYIASRDEARELLSNSKIADFQARIIPLAATLAARFPGQADVIREEGALLAEKMTNLLLSVKSFDTIHGAMKNALKDKFVFIGQTDADTTDIGVNPFHSEYVNVGTQGVVIDTILSRVFIVWLKPLYAALFCLLTVVLMFTLNDFQPAWRAAYGFISAFLALFLSFLLFRFSGIFLNPLSLVFSLTAAVVFREIYAYVLSDREKRFIRKAFSTYVSDNLVKEIIADPSKLKLGGEKRHMSALFTDLKGFSTISEKLAPEDIVSLLNRYLTVVSDIILEEKGTIDKFEGDAVISFFGAPFDLADHAFRACVSAIKIKRVEEELNNSLREEKIIDVPLLTRIGINTGDMVAGNMGTESKMNYTIMGNSVNLASRLEMANKQYGTWILTTSPTIDQTRGRLLSRRLDRVRVVGINEPVQLYEVLETAQDAADSQKELVSVFEKAIALFEKRDWKNAALAFGEALEINPKDGPARLYLDRCKNPPEQMWDGVYNMDMK